MILTTSKDRRLIVRSYSIVNYYCNDELWILYMQALLYTRYPFTMQLWFVTVNDCLQYFYLLAAMFPFFAGRRHIRDFRHIKPKAPHHSSSCATKTHRDRQITSQKKNIFHDII